MLIQCMFVFVCKQDLVIEFIDFVSIVEEMIDLLVCMIGVGLMIEMWFELGLFLVYVDVIQFELVLVNLVVNVCDVMFDGGYIFILGYCFDVDLIGDYVCFCVVDEGIGMDKEMLDCVIELFFIIKGVGKGIGFGLLMV